MVKCRHRPMRIQTSDERHSCIVKRQFDKNNFFRELVR
jgi:hypothetical protein